MPEIIDAGNGETITVVTDSSSGESRMYDSSGQVVATNDGSGWVVADEDALEDLGIKIGQIEEQLTATRDLVTNGNLTVVRGAEYAQMPDYQYAQIDALNLKLGDFPDADEVRELYRENFYYAKADQIERIAHGYSTGRQVAEEIRIGYLDNEGNVSASVDQLGSQFETSDGIREDEVAGAEAENESMDDTSDGDEEETIPET